MRGLFITGTDTGVGKTHIACRIVRELKAAGYRVGVFKPACSGAMIATDGRPHWDDIDRLKKAFGRDIPDDQICPQRFLAPLAPPVAARNEKRSVDMAAIERGFNAWRTSRDIDILIVEGAGGLLCPLTDRSTVADFAIRLQLPLLIVSRLALGTINHTLMTVEAAQHRRLPIAGIVFNELMPTAADLSVSSNPEEVAGRCNVPVLGICRYESKGWLSRFGKATQLDWTRYLGDL